MSISHEGGEEFTAFYLWTEKEGAIRHAAPCTLGVVLVIWPFGHHQLLVQEDSTLTSEMSRGKILSREWLKNFN